LYTSNVESGSTKTEIKDWVELVIAMNSPELIMGHTMH
jgi:hypothetical protein